MNTLATKPSALSAVQLDQNAVELVKREHNCASLLVIHLVEILRKQAHLELGYSGLLDYCLNRLDLSIGQAKLRTLLAKLCLRLPEAESYLSKGEISLTTLAKLSNHISPENCTRLLRDCAGMSRLEVEAYLHELKVELSPQPIAAESAPLFAQFKDSPATKHNGSDSNFLSAVESNMEDFKPAASNAVMRFLECDPELLTNLERLAECNNSDGLKKHLLEVLRTAVNDSLEKRDPKRKIERRRKREAGRSKTRNNSTVQKINAKKETNSSKSRYVPDCDREIVFERAKYQCEFVGSTGHRCTQRVGLQVDHIQCHSKDGSNEIGNLRSLCKAHNLHAAKVEFGEKFIEAKIWERKAKRSD